LAEALAGAERDGVTGQRLTPYLLAALVRATQGAALEANLAAVRGNVRLGAQIAAAFGR
jgi:pseudouridine-5'-phosphate glycosidase